MAKKSMKRTYATSALIALASGGIVVSGFSSMIGEFSEEGNTNTSVRSHVMSVAEQVDSRIAGSNETVRETPISELVPDIKTSLPDTSIYVSGNYNEGYCIVGFNEKGSASDDGIIYAEKGGTFSSDNFSCSGEPAQMILLSGPGDNKVAGGAEYEEPKFDGMAKFLFGSFIGIGGLIFAGGRIPYTGEGKNDLVLSELSSSNFPQKRTLAAKLSTLTNNEETEASTPNNSAERLVNRYHSVKTEWSTYELDLLKVLEYPAVTDMSIPATGEFHKALHLAEFLVPDSPTSALSQENLERLEKSVLDLEHKFKAMLYEAKRLKWSSYSPKEQSSLRTAQNLLSIATNSASSTNERQVAYKRLIKELEGIIVVPEKAMEEIEAKVLPELSASNNQKEFTA